LRLLLLLLRLTKKRFPENRREEQRSGSTQRKAMAHRFSLRQ
jgi:hypothetical protein